MDYDAFLDTLSPADREALDAIHDLLEASGMLSPKFSFGDQFDVQQLAIILADHARRCRL